MIRFTSLAAAMLLATAANAAVLTTLAGAPAPIGAAPITQAVRAPMLPATSAVVAEAAAALKAGDYHWAADPAAEQPVLIAVSIADQKLYAWRGGELFAVSTVSTGKRGHATPTGAFPIMEKHREHYSSKYDNAPMPFMQRLTGDGVALHAGRIPGYPASHGCVRLPLAFAERLFAVTKRGGTVVITDRPLAALAAQGATFDGRALQPLPPPLPPVIEEPASAPASLIAAVLPGWRGWSVD